ncbi:F-box domain containing protein [Carex littledalei]|uniref:F-box domain containing protein n=1 Tax=Carex littledalei TaxID=544730 RepID=A0A833QV57_9POAL|nr:F-box domain containing protein [Carex littledalei]
MNKTRATRPCTKNGEVDWIGSLPDEVLTHILSFLSTKEAVQTCVLSKRWKNTWANVPILDIKHEDFLVFMGDNSSGDSDEEGDDCSGDSDEEWRIAAARFERFMTGFLDNRAPTNLDRVCCMRYIYRFEPDASVGWLDRVALLMPQLIDIMIISGNSLDVPDLVFSCASLQHLSMTLYTLQNTIIKPVSINLPSLKILKLSQVELHDDFLQKLFMGCPSLETLILRGSDLYFSGICSEVLKELALYNCHLYEQMEISCPTLVSLCMMINIKRGGV